MRLFKPNIKKMKYLEDVAGLIKAMDDDEWEIRVSAIEALGELKVKRSIAPLIEVLKKKIPLESARAAYALGEIGGPQVVQPLIDSLHYLIDYDTFGRYPFEITDSAAFALGKLGDPRAVEPLTDLLHHPDHYIQDRARGALGKIEALKANEESARIKKPVQDTSIQSQPVVASDSTLPKNARFHTDLGYQYFELGKLEEAKREYLLALQQDPNFALARSNLGFVYDRQGMMDDAIREWEETLRRGVDSVTVRGNTEHWLRETKALRDERKKPIEDINAAISGYINELGQASERWQIAHDALSRIGNPAVDALISAMENENDLLRSRAVDLLGKIKDQRALIPLKRAANISEKDFRKFETTPGKVKTFVMGGTTLEVSVSDLLKEYRKDAKEAIRRINKK
jgi:HEAT repeat protein